jgi:hypothetical protein
MRGDATMNQTPPEDLHFLAMRQALTLLQSKMIEGSG